MKVHCANLSMTEPGLPGKFAIPNSVDCSARTTRQSGKHQPCWTRERVVPADDPKATRLAAVDSGRRPPNPLERSCLN
jgi:hypothetical protein